MVECKRWFEVEKRDFQKEFLKILEQKESKKVGFFDLPINSEPLLAQIEKFKQSNPLIKHNRLKDLVIVGIGGSSLGTRAVDDLLRFSKNRNIINLHFLENLDPIFLFHNLRKIEFDQALFLVVSKSGTTVETISLAKYLVDFIKKRNLIDNYKEHVAIITDKDSALDKLALKLGIESFEVPANVGGRFSVLSSVGLVPLSILGYDVAKLLSGANIFREEFFAQKHNHLLFEKAHYYTHSQANINVLFSYSSLFESFNKWYIQLWAESLGKIDSNNKRVGLTPIGLIGSIDQHSFLQLIVQGPRDKTVTFIKVKHFDIPIKIPQLHFEFLEQTDFVNGKTFQAIINAQCDATLQSVVEEGVATDLIEIDRLDEKSVGYLIYYYEVLTAICGVMLGVNAYDQPGVEAGKKKLYDIVTKGGN